MEEPTCIVTTVETTRKILEIVPLSMRAIRSEIREISALDITVHQFRILSDIVRDQHTLSTLAIRYKLTPPGISKILSELVAKGLVRRVRVKGDRRKHSLRATDEGVHLYQELSSQIEERISQRVDTLSDSDHDDLLRGLSILEGLWAHP